MSDLETILSESDVRNLHTEMTDGYVNHGPYYAEFHITDKCNSSCYFCNQRKFRLEGQELELSKLQRVISQLANNGLRMIRLSGGGDPTLHPHIIEIVELISSLNIRIARFDTNGIKLTTSLSDVLIDAGLKTLHISLQAPTAKMWSQVTGRRTSDFYAVLRNLKQFVKLNRNTRVYVSFIIDKVTLNSIPQIFSLCQSLGVQIRIHDLNSFTYSEDFLDEGVPVLMKHLLSLETKHLKRFRFEVLTVPKSLLDNKFASESQVDNNIVCLAPWVGLLIRANGNVYPCCALMRASNVLGNVLEQDIMDVWCGKKYSILRSEAAALFFNRQLDPDLSVKELRFLERQCLGNCVVKQGLFGCKGLSQA